MIYLGAAVFSCWLSHSRRKIYSLRSPALLYMFLLLSLTVAYTVYNGGIGIMSQSAMLASFQKTSSVDANRMNGIIGLAVCVLISLLGVSLICYASKL